jgi:hypothetical protein
VAAHLLHAPPLLAVRGFTHRREEESGSSGIWLDFLSLPFLAGGEDHCYLQQKKKMQQQVLVPFPSRFFDLLLHKDFFFSFSFAFFSILGGRL